MSTATATKGSTIKIKDINISNFLAYLQNADILKPLIIEITKDKIKCKAFPTDKSWVKYTAAPLTDIMKFEHLPPDFEVIKLAFTKLSKLKNVLEIYQKTKIDKMNADIIFSDDGPILLADQIKFTSKTMKTTVRCSEITLIDYMPDAIWDKITNKNGLLAKFDAKKPLLFRLEKLSALTSDSSDVGADESSTLKMLSFIIGMRIGADSKDLFFRSVEKDNWQILYTQEDGNVNISTDKNIQLYTPKAAATRLDGDMFDVYITQNMEIGGSYVMTAEKDEDNIVTHLLSEYKGEKTT